jgi:hypothetical protein
MSCPTARLRARSIGGVDHGPRRAGRWVAPATMWRAFRRGVVLPVVFPIVVGDAPGGVGIALERPETVALVFLGQLEPDFEDQRAVVGEQFSKWAMRRRFSWSSGPAPGLPVRAGFRVPGAGVDADAAARRAGCASTATSAAGRAPRRWAVKRKTSRRRADRAIRVEGVEHIAFAGGLDAGDDDQHEFEGRALELHLQLDELLAQLGGSRPGSCSPHWCCCSGRAAPCSRSRGANSCRG